MCTLIIRAISGTKYCVKNEVAKLEAVEVDSEMALIKEVVSKWDFTLAIAGFVNLYPDTHNWLFSGQYVCTVLAFFQFCSLHRNMANAVISVLQLEFSWSPWCGRSPIQTRLPCYDDHFDYKANQNFIMLHSDINCIWWPVDACV